MTTRSNVFALSLMVLAAAAVIISQARHGLRWLDWLGQSQGTGVDLQAFNPLILLDSGWSLALLIPILAMLALLSAVAVYVATERQ